MGMFCSLKPGTWWIKSNLDSRWNKSGRGEVGLFAMPPEVAAEIEDLKALFGEPPEDLEWGYMKD